MGRGAPWGISQLSTCQEGRKKAVVMGKAAWSDSGYGRGRRGRREMWQEGDPTKAVSHHAAPSPP